MLSASSKGQRGGKNLKAIREQFAHIILEMYFRDGVNFSISHYESHKWPRLVVGLHVGEMCPSQGGAT